MALKTPLIAHIVHRFGVGGLENGVVNLVNRMHQGRWRHMIVALTDVSPEFANRIERSDVQCVALGKQPGHLVREYPRLVRLFRKFRPTILHTRNLAALEAVVPAWAAGVPVRIHGEHGWDMQDPDGLRRRYRYIRRIYRPFVSRYVALSHHLEDYLQRQVGVPPDLISQVYNGVDTERFHPAADTRPAISGCPFVEPDQWLVGTVGRMEAVKDPLNLALAFVRARQLLPSAARHLRLIMVGDGSMRSAVTAVLDRAGVREQVWFAGERADIPEVMRGLDCFVLPSLAEGVSNTILEAMASRLPVIATRVGGNAELIESRMTGTLVAPADSEALAQAIVGYFSDRMTARRHAKAAQRLAESRFSLSKMILNYASMYEQALAAAGIAVPADGDGPRNQPVASTQTTAPLN